MPDETKDVVIKEEPAKDAPKVSAPTAEQVAPVEEVKETPPEKADYKPIEAKDEKANPVYIELPKSGEEVAKEGTKLAEAEAVATGGTVPFLDSTPKPAKRIWSLDAEFNTNDRNKEGNKPDFVEYGS